MTHQAIERRGGLAGPRLLPLAALAVALLGCGGPPLRECSRATPCGVGAVCVVMDSAAGTGICVAPDEPRRDERLPSGAAGASEAPDAGAGDAVGARSAAHAPTGARSVQPPRVAPRPLASARPSVLSRPFDG